MNPKKTKKFFSKWIGKSKKKGLSQNVSKRKGVFSKLAPSISINSIDENVSSSTVAVSSNDQVALHTMSFVAQTEEITNDIHEPLQKVTLEELFEDSEQKFVDFKREKKVRHNMHRAILIFNFSFSFMQNTAVNKIIHNYIIM